MSKRLRLGLAQRLNIGNFEGVEVHVELEEDLEPEIKILNSTQGTTFAALSEKLAELWEKEAVAALIGVQERRAGNTAAGEMQQQILSQAKTK
jgi:hypothetical protein